MKNFEYYYWVQLINAIEEYTKSKPYESFYYDDVDFVAALEKKLYFEISGSNYSLQVKQAINDGLPVIVKDNTHHQILTFAFKEKNLVFLVKKDLTEFIKRFIYSHVVFLNSFLCIKNIKKTKKLTVRHSKYLFVSIHHKFIRYLAPIYNKLEHSIFLICGDCKDSIAICKKNDFRYVVLEYKVTVSKVSDIDLIGLVIVYEKIKRLIQENPAERIILPEGNVPIYELFNLIAQNHKGIKTICIQQGWSPVYHNGFRKMHFDKFLTWGVEFSERLKPYNEKQLFMATGSHILNINKIGTEQDSISFFLQSINSFISKDVFDSLIIFIEYIAKSHPDQRLIIREHPECKIMPVMKRQLLQYKNILFMNPDRYTLTEVLSKTKISISIYSTVLLESMLYDAVPFIFNLVSLPSYEPDLAHEDLAIEVKELDEAKNMIDKVLSDENILLEYKRNILKKRKNYFQCFGEKAINIIVREILA